MRLSGGPFRAIELIALLLSCAFVIPSFSEGVDNRGTDFWMALSPEMQEPVLLITSEFNAYGLISIPGMFYSTTFALKSGERVRIPLPIDSTVQLDVVDGIEDKGVKITANNDVAIFGYGSIPGVENGFLALATKALGCQYTIVSYNNPEAYECEKWLPYYDGIGCGSDLMVVATQDDTEISIIPSIETGLHPAGIPFTVTLNQGQVYRLANTQSGTIYDLSGSRIVSNRPIAAYGGYTSEGYPFTVSQIPPERDLGTVYMAVPFAERTSGDLIRLVAIRDETRIYRDGALVATLAKGKIYETTILESAWFTANYPVLAAQFMQSVKLDHTTGCYEMMILVPEEHFLDDYIVATDDADYWDHYMNFIVPTGAIGTLSLDGSPVSPAIFNSIASSGYSGAQLLVDGGSHRVTCTEPFGLYLYGLNPDSSYANAAGRMLWGNRQIESSPIEATLAVETTHCVKTLIMDNNGYPQAGASFELICSGTNSWTMPGITGADGTSIFCYSSDKVGTDFLMAAVMGGGNCELSGPLKADWIIQPMTPQFPQQYHGPLRIFPNPFIRSQAARRTVKIEGVDLGARVRIYTSRGLKVWERQVERPFILEWDGCNEAGKSVCPGTYIWVVEDADFKKHGTLMVE